MALQGSSWICGCTRRMKRARSGDNDESGKRPYVKFDRITFKDDIAIKCFQSLPAYTNELDMLRKVSACAYVVSVKDANEENMTLVLERYPSDLISYLLSGEPLTRDEMRPLFHDMLASLTFCHNLDIVHNDIKPENILLTFNDKGRISKATLCDFEHASVLKCDETKRAFSGTYVYAAPEKLKGELFGFSSDVWSCGVCFFVSVEKQMPFDIDDDGLPDLECEPRDWDSLWQAYDGTYLKLTQACLRKTPSDRALARDLLTEADSIT